MKSTFRSIWYLLALAAAFIEIGCPEMSTTPSPSDSTAPTTLDSEPSFTIGLYCVNDPADFPEIAEAGFNLVQSYRFEGIDTATDEEAKAYLDRAQGAGLRVLLGMQQEAVQDPQDPEKQDLAVIEKRIRALERHPALFAWNIYDEPESTGYGRSQTIAKDNYLRVSQTIKRLDTLHHPVLVISGAAIDDRYEYLDGTDMMMLQYSILPEGIYDPPWDKLENLREAHRSSFATLASKTMPFLWTIQAYNLANDSEMWPDVQRRMPQAVGRYPSREEMRFMAYSGILEGAKGVIFSCYRFDYGDGSPGDDISRRNNPSQWEAVSRVSAELRSVAPILLAPPSRVQVTAPSETGVEFVLKDYQDRMVLIAVNPREQGRTITFTFSEPPRTVTVLNESRTIVPQENSFTDDFAGYGVHLYEIGK